VAPEPTFAAGGVAVGLFCGLIPGPLQMLGAAIVATVLRVNLPLALLCTLYTNPLTIVPLYLVAFGYGEFVLGLVDGGTGGRFVSPPEWGHQSLTVWVPQLVDWMGGLGKPLFVGLVLLGSTLAALGYFPCVPSGATAWCVPGSGASGDADKT